MGKLKEKLRERKGKDDVRGKGKGKMKEWERGGENDGR